MPMSRSHEATATSLTASGRTSTLRAILTTILSRASRKSAFSPILISDAPSLETPIWAQANANVAEASARVNDALVGLGATGHLPMADVITDSGLTLARADGAVIRAPGHDQRRTCLHGSLITPFIWRQRRRRRTAVQAGSY